MAITLDAITIATTHMQEMVAFYNATLATQLEPFEPIPDTTFYRGQLAGIPLTMCPNKIANVDAHQNRQQFHLTIPDAHDAFIAALNHGGTEISAIEEQGNSLICAVYDPDGNSIVFRQVIST